MTHDPSIYLVGLALGIPLLLAVVYWCWTERRRRPAKSDNPAIACARQAEATAQRRAAAIDALLDVVNDAGGTCVVVIRDGDALLIKGGRSAGQAAAILMCAATAAAGDFIKTEGGNPP